MGSREEETRVKAVQELAESGCGPSDRHIHREEDRQIPDLPLATDVPVVDLRRLRHDEDEADKLSSTVQSWGLFHVIGHDLSPSFLDAMLDVSKKFFQLPVEVKQKYSNLAKGGFQSEGYGNDIVATKDQIIDWNDRLYLLVQPEDSRKLSIGLSTPTL